MLQQTGSGALPPEIIDQFLRQLRPEECPAFLRDVLDRYPLDLFVDALAQAVHREKLVPMAEAALRVRDCEAFAPQVKEIKTVASFYFRLYNGGLERVVALLAPIWQSAGYRVVILTEEEPTPNDYPLPPGVMRAVLPKLTDDCSTRLRAWRELIQQYQIDAVVYHAFVNENRFLDALAVKSQGIPFLLHTHTLATFVFRYPFFSRVWQEAEDALSDVVITLSEVDQAWWSALGFCSIETINPLTYLPQACVPSPLVSHDAVWIGRLSEEKQYRDAFEIARLVRAQVPDFHLHVVGKTETDQQFACLQKEIQSRGMADYLILDGFHTDMEPFYRQASLLLCTSAYEGAPMTMVEAQTFGLPLVTYELPSVSVVREGCGICVVPQRDQVAAAGCIVKLLQDDDQRHKLGVAARSRAEERAKFDFVSHWQSIFTLSLQPKPPRPPLYCQPPMQTALCLAMRQLSQNLVQTNEVFQQQLEAAQLREKQLQAAYEQVLHSTSWKLTKPLRLVVEKWKKRR